jgi:hypothetical protein
LNQGIREKKDIFALSVHITEKRKQINALPGIIKGIEVIATIAWLHFLNTLPMNRNNIQHQYGKT